jgi:hypothetical protein
MRHAVGDFIAIRHVPDFGQVAHYDDLLVPDAVDDAVVVAVGFRRPPGGRRIGMSRPLALGWIGWQL